MDRVSPYVVCSWWRKVSTVWRREGVKKGCQAGGMRVRSGGVGGDCGGGGDEDGDEDGDEEGEEGIVGMVGIMRECVVWGTVVMVVSITAVSYMCVCVCVCVCSRKPHSLVHLTIPVPFRMFPQIRTLPRIRRRSTFPP